MVRIDAIFSYSHHSLFNILEKPEYNAVQAIAIPKSTLLTRQISSDILDKSVERYLNCSWEAKYEGGRK